MISSLKAVSHRIMRSAIILIFLSLCPLWSMTAAAQVVSLSATAISFGTVTVGTTSTRLVSISNTGTSNLRITAIAATGDFHSNNCANSTILPQGSCSVRVSFTPATTVSSTGSLAITDNASNSPQVVSLSGPGIASVTLSSPSLTFPNQAVGTTSAAKTVSLMNKQTLPLTIASVTAT